jgi:hypothetical protein
MCVVGHGCALQIVSGKPSCRAAFLFFGALLDRALGNVSSASAGEAIRAAIKMPGLPCVFDPAHPENGWRGLRRLKQDGLDRPIIQAAIIRLCSSTSSPIDVHQRVRHVVGDAGPGTHLEIERDASGDHGTNRHATNLAPQIKAVAVRNFGLPALSQKRQGRFHMIKINRRAGESPAKNAGAA